ncbi:hypothetical protein JG687_00005864 [Phytophthora cactorum]|uniref:DNA mismatch repair proteins mutS family domain-containing protein n=1 Tax=Phytophthora cactorum TaxID=29920 RepID=A0A8T1UJY4_9STRA|nr:hypothetical protein JG687_00005864 [Phytophthora cactorum]
MPDDTDVNKVSWSDGQYEQRREEKGKEELSEPSDVEVEDEELVFMSVLFDRGELGVAIYNALTTSLKTLQLQIADPRELEELDDVDSLYFSTVEQVALDGFMYIDKSTLQSLQIFNHEAHPSLVKVNAMNKGSGRAKEGFRSLIESVCETSNSPLPNVFSRVKNERGVIQVSNLLGNVVDFEESQQESTVVIRSGVSETLDAARERYEDLDNVLTEVAFQVQEANPVLSSITVQYIPQVGYVICCESPTTLPDFVFQFQEDDTTFYYKDACCRDLDESIGDIYELLEELTMALLEYESSIHEMTWIMSYLDCLISFASCAKSFNFTRPQISEGNTLKAIQARHPLQELLVEHYIPNDIFLDSSDSLKVVTGHNGSGKSVYLKMVGLLQYMAQIGSFVPADKAEMGLVTKIFTRIQSMESATVSQSSFTIDCNQMAWMLNHGDGRSLFLVDEFGKGS